MNIELKTDVDMARAAVLAARGIAPTAGSKVEDTQGATHVILVYEGDVTLSPELDTDPAFPAALAAVSITRTIDNAPRFICRELANGKQLVISSNATQEEVRAALAAAQ